MKNFEEKKNLEEKNFLLKKNFQNFDLKFKEEKKKIKLFLYDLDQIKNEKNFYERKSLNLETKIFFLLQKKKNEKKKNFF